MSNRTNSSRDHQPEADPQSPKSTIEQLESVEDEPAVDRGERIATGKAIARGGHDSGHVAGAEAQPPEKTTRKKS